MIPILQLALRSIFPRAYLLFLTGSMITRLGDALYTFAIPWISFELTGSPLIMSSLFATSVLPIVIFGPFVGVMVDRLNRRKLMLSTDIIRALLVALIPLLHMAGLLQIWHLYVISFLLAVLSMLFDVSTVAVIPQIAGSQLTKANSAFQLVGQLCQMAGPVLAGSVIAVIGGFSTLWVNAVSFAGTFIVLLYIRNIKPPEPNAAINSIFKSMGEGFTWLKRNPLNLAFSLQALIGNFGYSVAFAVLVFYLRSDLGLSAEQIGINFALLGVGGLLGTMLIVPLEKHLPKSAVFPVLLSFGTVGFVAAMLPGFWLAPGIGFGMVTACNVAWNVLVTSIRQQTVPQEMIGRVLSFSRVLTRLAMPVGAMTGGIVAAHFDIKYVFVIAAAAKAVEVLIAIKWIGHNLVIQTMQMNEYNQKEPIHHS